jgi:hypothetical protein
MEASPDVPIAFEEQVHKTRIERADLCGLRRTKALVGNINNCYIPESLLKWWEISVDHMSTAEKDSPKDCGPE